MENWVNQNQQEPTLRTDIEVSQGHQTWYHSTC